MSNTPHVTPQIIVEATWAFTRSRVLVTAVELGLFSRIAEGCCTVDALVQAIGASPRGLTALVDALTALGLLQRDDRDAGKHVLTPVSEKFLVEGRPEYLGGIVLEVNHEWDAWAGLTGTVRTAKPHRSVDTQEDGEAFFAGMLEGLHAVSLQPARNLARALEVAERKGGLDVLDIGAGSSPWGIAIAEANAAAKLTLVDWPMPLAKAREAAARAGIADRIRELPGDAQTVKIEDGAYDMVLFGHTLRLFDRADADALLRRAARALRSGGRVVVMEIPIPSGGASGPSDYFAASVALNTVVNTRGGYPYTPEELDRALVLAGFSGTKVLQKLGPFPIVVGTRS